MVQTKYYCIILLLPRSQILDLPGCDSQIGSSSIMMLLKRPQCRKAQRKQSSELESQVGIQPCSYHFHFHSDALYSVEVFGECVFGADS